MKHLKNFFFLLFFAGIYHLAFSQNKAIDVTHYRFKIALNDTSNIIQGKATINFIAKNDDDKVYFDLDKKNDSTGNGMTVTEVTEGSHPLRFLQEKERLYIYFNNSFHRGEEKEVSIKYDGIPSDGFIISKNEYGQRTFFADNWPERAHDWIPCNDHPSDKAYVDFIVTAPDHYQVVGNGQLVEETSLPNNMRLWHWKTKVVLPTKVMAIGVADFAVQLDTVIDHIPIQSWVFSPNRDSGFAQYAVSKDILPFYIHYIGPYPYQKLANVQSKTRFGGLEDASNIFYNEKSISLHPKNPAEHRFLTEALMAHETAHQWFGDNVTETNWQHLWLSEGFATFFTNLYLEHRYGETIFKDRLIHDRTEVIGFYKHRETPVVDTSGIRNPMILLNPNSYQKGGWVLYMLMQKLGDVTFRNGIRKYYEEYQERNANTNDFKEVMEKVSHQNIEEFFRQWLFTPGQPELDCLWHFDNRKKYLSITIHQTQNVLFQFPLQIGIKVSNCTIIKTLNVQNKVTVFHIPLKAKPDTVVLDPNVHLLFEGKINETE